MDPEVPSEEGLSEERPAMGVTNDNVEVSRRKWLRMGCVLICGKCIHKDTGFLTADVIGRSSVVDKS